MKKNKVFSSRYPLLFLLLIVLGWYILQLIIKLLIGPLPNPNPTLMPQLMIRSLALLGYLLFVVVILWRVGWMRADGILRLGSWQIWLVAVCILIYKIPTE
jgi:hypothetical protein